MWHRDIQNVDGRQVLVETTAPAPKRRRVVKRGSVLQVRECASEYLTVVETYVFSWVTVSGHVEVYKYNRQANVFTCVACRCAAPVMVYSGITGNALKHWSGYKQIDLLVHLFVCILVGRRFNYLSDTQWIRLFEDYMPPVWQFGPRMLPRLKSVHRLH